MIRTVTALAVGATLALGLAAGAQAHAKLIKSSPPAGGVAKDARTLELTFNEALSGKLSGADVIDATGKKVPSNAMPDQGTKGLMVMLKAPLKPGVYKVAWHAVASDDGHRTTGAFDFKVK